MKRKENRTMEQQNQGNAAEKRKEPLVSIIVPVYQVREYLRECVESLRQQTYTNLEILLVDDGSTDGSGEMCDEYERQDDRIRVIHQENRGLSGARNTGLDHARGAYIAFVDSDDMVLPEYIEVLYGLLMRYEADIAACGYQKGAIDVLQEYREHAAVRSRFAVKRDTAVHKQEALDGAVAYKPEAMHAAVLHKSEEEYRATVCHSAVMCGAEVCMSAEEMLRQWHGKYKQQETVAWNKLYRRKVWNGGRKMRFPEGRKHEDVLTSHIVVQGAEKVALTTRKLYLYRVREGSIITQEEYTREGIRENLQAQRERMAFFKEKRYWRAYYKLLWGYWMHVGWFGWRAVRRHWH